MQAGVKWPDKMRMLTHLLITNSNSSIFMAAPLPYHSGIVSATAIEERGRQHSQNNTFTLPLAHIRMTKKDMFFDTANKLLLEKAQTTLKCLHFLTGNLTTGMGECCALFFCFFFHEAELNASWINCRHSREANAYM